MTRLTVEDYNESILKYNQFNKYEFAGDFSRITGDSAR